MEGVDGAAAQNLYATVDLLRLEDEDVPAWQWSQLVELAPEQIQEALKPFGYYQAEAQVEVEAAADGSMPGRYRITVVPGTPVQVRELDLGLRHPSGQLPKPFQEWLEQWPLAPGTRLNQARYEEAKQALVRLAEREGYFQFDWLTQEILIQPDLEQADIHLHFATGEQARFGQLQWSMVDFSPQLLQRFVELKTGDPYATTVVNRLRDDLSTSGYFNQVAVVEEVDRKQQPAVVNLRIELEPRPPNTYTTTLGFGTDTGPRAQFAWDRHYLGPRGDRLNLAAGAQQQNSEFVIRGNYERPRGNDPDEYWFTKFIARREEEDFRFEDSSNDEQVFPELDGNQQQFQLDLGLLRDQGRDGPWPIRERWFLSYLYDRFDALDRSELLPEQIALLEANPRLEPNLQVSQQVISAGASWDLGHIQGHGFEIHGTSAQLRLAGALKDVGSDISFAQVYLRARHSRVLGDNHKILLRGELGYTEAATRDFSIALDDRTLDLSISRLPESYRFKAGGDRSVRGYGFESLSNNRIGSNHLLSFSAEYEYRVAANWSVAGFYDVGNAFNRFSDISLRHGVGIGARWYSLVGPVRLDLARGLDEPGDGLRIHITIGSPLL